MKDRSLFDRVTAGLEQAIAHQRGDAVGALAAFVPADADVRAVRARIGLTEEQFAAKMQVSLATLRDWEQGRLVPDGPARVLLALLDRNPRIVEETLGNVA
ncbi:helix-turn-helix domain-containing protein [Chthonobacter albigriseus]|uniref:helix-turn-helix domain-containing protein n=1 Tax=Chthonobacter albigriseus TaxID=1683161 RepID=UPI0015EF5FB6|nr:helix-turn-helix domain-containing protein [Chthonobacter albigriseus]